MGCQRDGLPDPGQRSCDRPSITNGFPARLRSMGTREALEAAVSGWDERGRSGADLARLTWRAPAAIESFRRGGFISRRRAKRRPGSKVDHARIEICHVRPTATAARRAGRPPTSREFEVARLIATGDQHRDRRRAVHRPEDGERLRRVHPGQARRPAGRDRSLGHEHRSFVQRIAHRRDAVSAHVKAPLCRSAAMPSGCAPMFDRLATSDFAWDCRTRHRGCSARSGSPGRSTWGSGAASSVEPRGRPVDAGTPRARFRRRSRSRQ
jgi:hypothetical protein